ncbi:PqqD family protein [Bradyrhizobium sp.]|uniref:PqqD family protein n=1 Tax=Bradyrhizobium sp. TaxID=376 RepID=UPI001D44801C|nr:PqqD family protein [Bradyrhizobium sp.]MBI5322475.1 PqqD family protein [Bradyrhizobium sp.]
MRIRLAPGTTLTNVDGKDVLFSVRSGDSYGLNETAARMVRLALEMGLDDASARLADEYGATRAELRGDLDVLIGELVQLKLAEACSDQGG